MWNSRRTTGTAFAEVLETFLERWGTDYVFVRETYGVRGRLGEFFPGAQLHRTAIENPQILDADNFRQRILSASYMPSASHASHLAMLAELDALFDRHQDGGVIRLELDAELFWAARN